MKPTTAILHLIRLSLCCLTVLAVAACSKDDHGTEEWTKEYGTHFQVIVRTNSGRDVRAVYGPEGGEGDREEATDNEAKAYNATVLLYQSDDGINATDAEAAGICISHALYAPTLTWDEAKKAYVSPTLWYKGYIGSGTYHVILLVNMGDMTSLQGKTLAEVRSMKYERLPWTGTGTDVASYDHFIMTSTADRSITFHPDMSGPNHPVVFETTVCRLAARIDFSPGNGTYSNTPMTFTPEGGTETTIHQYYEYSVTGTTDKYYLTGWCPFNLRKDNCYLLRRVADNYTGTQNLEYLGEQKTVGIPGATGTKRQQTNFVIDPLTPTKTTANITKWDFNTIFDKPYYDDEKTPFPYDTQIKSGTELPVWDGEYHYHTLAYTLENTLRTDSPKQRYATGIAFKGYYARAKGDGTYTYTAKNYTYYIRHSDPNNSNNEAIVMKYGIVRNSIYRVYINSFSPNGQLLIETVNWLNVHADDIYL